ncbi:MAG: GTP cyclohydrolase II [Litoreibacter sp.]|nr:GTP cyclohydrolase II [Litoreibacter sp.]
MSLLPTTIELLARARADLRMGVPIVMGNQLVLPVETVSKERIATLRAASRPLTLAMTAWRAQTLKARIYDGDIARIEVPEDAPLSWMQALADPADDLSTPMKGPLKSLRGGTAEVEKTAITIAKTAQLLPCVLSTPLWPGLDTREFTKINPRAAQNALATAGHLVPVVAANLPIEVSEAGRLHVFRPEDGGEEHYAIEIGRPSRSEPVLTRLHSACFTGDVLGSLKCDCGPQLRGALAQMGAEGEGVLLYLNQEGRGIGLANKMRAYFLQDQGFDTVEANHRLGFEDDERDFRIGASLLKSMGFTKIRLLTNNPRKVNMLNECGMQVVERVPLKVGEGRFNKDYLATKAEKSGHLL